MDWLTLVIYPYFNFFLFLILLVWFARKPLNLMAYKKNQEYEKHFEQTRAAQLVAKEHLEVLEKRFNELDQELLTIEKKAQHICDLEKEAMEQNTKQMTKRLEQEVDHRLQMQVYHLEGALKKQLIEKSLALVEDQLKNLSPSQKMTLTKEASIAFKQVL